MWLKTSRQRKVCALSDECISREALGKESIMTYKTEQENFWAGDFGNEYIHRNQGDTMLASNLSFFARALRRTHGIKNCIEFGANIGLNLKALKILYPVIDLHAIEINAEAARQLSGIIPSSQVHNESILDFESTRQWDLTLIKGVLIHINPNMLSQVYDKLFTSCGRYLLVAEYYNPTPMVVSYRKHHDRLFKRDFAGEILDRHPQLELRDYGFVYRRDPNFPQDDITWFLLEKKQSTA